MKRNELQYQTVKPILRSTLERLMEMEEFAPFRLVGGTSLSLRYGHRMSDDIDLFTDAEYGSLDFHKLQDIHLQLLLHIHFLLIPYGYRLSQSYQICQEK